MKTRAPSDHPLVGMPGPALLRTVHGSRLYGLAHADSDHDYYEVRREPRDLRPELFVKHLYHFVERKDGVVLDTTTVGLSTFMRLCAEGVPQALEALYAPEPEVDVLGAFRLAFRVDPHLFAAKTRHAVTQNVAAAADQEQVAEAARAAGDEATAVRADATAFKGRRHAVRLVLNLHDALTTGRFSPRLDQSRLLRVDHLASNYPARPLAALLERMRYAE